MFNASPSLSLSLLSPSLSTQSSPKSPDVESSFKAPVVTGTDPSASTSTEVPAAGTTATVDLAGQLPSSAAELSVEAEQTADAAEDLGAEKETEPLAEADVRTGSDLPESLSTAGEGPALSGEGEGEGKGLTCFFLASVPPYSSLLLFLFQKVFLKIFRGFIFAMLRLRSGVLCLVRAIRSIVPLLEVEFEFCPREVTRCPQEF